MEPYDKLIIKLLDGETPKEKYEFLINLLKKQSLINSIHYTCPICGETFTAKVPEFIQDEDGFYETVKFYCPSCEKEFRLSI